MDIGLLLSHLLGVSHPDPTQAVQPQTQPQGQPVMPQMPVQSAPVQQMPPQAADSSPITVEADRWKPKKESFLGTLADIILHAPVFRNKIDEQNMGAAMHNFTDNPLLAIKRLSELNGHRGEAWNMYNTYQNNQRADAANKRLETVEADREHDHAMDVATSMLGAANAKNYSAIKPMIQKYLDAKGVSDLSLPDQWDPDAISALRYGNVKTKDQMTLQEMSDYRGQRLDQMQQSINNREQYSQSRLDQMNTRLSQQEGAMSERERHDRATEAHAAVKEPHVMKTPQGMMELSPSGITGRIGDQIWQKVNSDGKTGTWKRIK
jgi:hypothetical protein